MIAVWLFTLISCMLWLMIIIDFTFLWLRFCILLFIWWFDSHFLFLSWDLIKNVHMRIFTLYEVTSWYKQPVCLFFDLLCTIDIVEKNILIIESQYSRLKLNLLCFSLVFLEHQYPIILSPQTPQKWYINFNIKHHTL